MKTIRERIDAAIASELAVPLDVSPEDHVSLREDLGADSLDVLCVVMEIEKEFDIEISDEEHEKLHTVGDVRALIAGRGFSDG